MNDQSGAPAASSTSQDQDINTADAWRKGAITYAILAVLVGCVMWNAAASIYHTAMTSNTFGHILLIPLVVAWLINNRWPELKQLRPAPMPKAGFLLFGTGFLWLLGQAADVLLVQQAAFVGSLQILVLTVFGRLGLAALAFPTFFLIFLVPFGEEFVPQLQDITAHFVVQGLNFLGIPVYTDGVFLQTPSGDFEVAEACSGIRFMVSTFALGTLFSVLCFKSPMRRATVILLSLLIPIVANGIRAFGIVYIAYLTDNTVAVGVDHLIYGWIFFAFVTIVLILVGLTFSDRSVQDPPIDVAQLKPLEANDGSAFHQSKYLRSGAFAVSIVALFFALNAWIDGRRPEVSLADFAAPTVSGEWSPLEGFVGDGWLPNYNGADTTSLQHFSDGKSVVSLYRAAYTYQRQGAELIGFGNTVVAPNDDDQWGRAAVGRRAVKINGRDVSVHYTRLRSRWGTLREVWQVYWVNGKMVSSPVRVKIETVIAKLTGGPLYTATLAISAPLQSAADTKRGEPDMARFGQHIPELEQLLTSSAGGR
ncbi:MAG: exosortase A [Pseudomonadota bacterium]